MNERPSTQLTQVALAILLVVGVFAGGVAIAFAAADDVPDVQTTTASELDETAAASDNAAESADQAEVPEPVDIDKADIDKESDAAPIAESSCFIDPPPDVIAEMAAENAELAALLDRYGIEYEEVDFPDGFSSIEYDWNDPIVESLVQSFYEDRYAPSEEEIAEMQAINQALIDAFDAAGIDYGFEEFEGHSWIDWDYDDDAANAVADEILEELHPDFEELVVDFEETCFDEEWEPSEDELAEMTELNDALVTAFDEAGIAYERIVEDPFEWIEWDYDDDSANEIADGVYEEHYGPIDECGVIFGDEFGEFEEFGPIADVEFFDEFEPTAEDMVENDRVNAALAAAFEAAGIDFEMIEDAPFEFVEWDYENDAANAVADDVLTELFPNDFADFAEGEFICDEIVEGEFVEGLEFPDDLEDEVRNGILRNFAADLEAAGVEVNLHEEDEEYGGWVWVTFDYENDAAIPVVQAAMATTN